MPVSTSFFSTVLPAARLPISLSPSGKRAGFRFGLQTDHFDPANKAVTQQRELFALFKIDPALVAVKAEGCEVSETDKRELLAMYLKAHHIAIRTKLARNHRETYGAGARLENGEEAYAPNHFPPRQREAMCSERAALSAVYNLHLPEVLTNLERGILEDGKPYLKSLKVPIRDMVIANTKLGSYVTPCSSCQSWMQESTYYTPKSRIVTLDTDPKTGKYVLWVRTVDAILPMVQRQKASLTQQAIRSLPVQPSEEGKAVLAVQRISQKTLYRLMTAAQTAYGENPNAPSSQQNVGVAVLFSTGVIRSGAQIDWKKQRSPHPDMWVVSDGLEAVQRQQRYVKKLTAFVMGLLPIDWRQRLVDACTTDRPQWEARLPDVVYWAVQRLFPKEPIILALAYYGENPLDTPSVYSLELLSKKNWGGLQKAILVVEDDALKVRSIENYMAHAHVDSLAEESAKKP